MTSNGAPFAVISGTMCMVTANVPTLAGGAINEVSVQKSARLHTICMENRLPCINLTQSVSHAVELFVDRFFAVTYR